MQKLYASVRHNSGILAGVVACLLCLLFVYSCQSTVISLVNPKTRINRMQLVAEVDYMLAQAEARFDDLDRQDLVKGTIFNSVLDLAQGKPISPIGIAAILGNILGLGAIVDNVRKRTHINTLKGSVYNAKEKPK